MRRLLAFRTQAGTFYIASEGGMFHALFGDQSLGAYEDIAGAVEDLANGYTFWPSSGVDPSTLGIPEDPAEWIQV